VLKGAALVVPAGLLAARIPADTAAGFPGFAEDAATRAEIEARAMVAVMAAERSMGFEPRDVILTKNELLASLNAPEAATRSSGCKPPSAAARRTRCSPSITWHGI
jgi:hypothetical protein